MSQAPIQRINLCVWLCHEEPQKGTRPIDPQQDLHESEQILATPRRRQQQMLSKPPGLRNEIEELVGCGICRIGKRGIGFEEMGVEGGEGNGRRNEA